MTSQEPQLASEDPVFLELERLARLSRRLESRFPPWARTTEIAEQFEDIRWALLRLRRAYASAHPGRTTPAIRVAKGLVPPA